MTGNESSSSNGANSGGPITVAIVLDKSGSMSRLHGPVVEAYNGFLDELRDEDASAIRVSLTLFDTQFTHVYTAEPLAAVWPMTHARYPPGGMTALYDAIAHTAIDTERRLVR